MKQHTLRRLLLLLLAAVLATSVLPAAFAATYTDDAPLPTAETIPPDDEAPSSTDSSVMLTGTEFSMSEVMPAAAGQTLTVKADAPGYIYAKSGYEYTYVDKDGTTRTHTLDHITLWRDYGSPMHYMYCLEPPVYTNGSYTGAEVDGEQQWGNLSRVQQRLVGLTLLYGCPNRLDPSTTSDEWWYSIWMQGATQAIVWEIVLGYRDATTFALTDSTIKDAFSGSRKFVKTDGSEGGRSDLLETYYAELEKAILRHLSYPSFTRAVPNRAPTIDLYPDGSGKYTATVTDTNGALEDYTFQNGNGLTFQKSGNNLTITADASFSGSAVVAPTKVVPNLEKQAFILWTAAKDNDAGNGQVQVSTAGKTREDPVPVYFNVRLATGTLKIVKETNTGKNLDGWQFGVYTDAACSVPVAGSPFTSGADGTIAVNLAPATYYVKELGGKDGWQMDPAVRTVTVTSGQTATVTFRNVQLGGIRIVKTSEDGVVAGLMFNIFDVDENGEIIGSVDDQFYTDENGVALIPDLLPGWYEISELLPEDSPYIQPQKQIVEVKAGEITEVKFHNVLRPGEVSVRKVDPTGKPLSGAKFLLEWSLGGKTWRPVVFSEKVTFGGCTGEGLEDGCLVSGEDGLISFTGLYPDLQYRLTEVDAPDGYTLLTDYAFVGSLPADTLTVTVEVVNMPVFVLPATGSFARIHAILAGTGLCMTALLLGGCVCMESKKQQKEKIERN